MATDRPIVWEAAKAYVKAGLSCIPIRTDGSKAPAVDEWTTYKSRLPTQAEIDEWFAHECGVAIIGGAVSGGLETLDFESEEIFFEWAAIVYAQAPWLEKKLINTITPGKFLDADGKRIPGRHVRYRVKDYDIPGNQKLARVPKAGKELKEAIAKKEAPYHTMIETRGEGGYALAPGSCKEAHPACEIYKNVEGHRISDVETITASARWILINAAEALNRYVEPEREYKPTPVNGVLGDRPGDEFNAKSDFTSLINCGWKMVTQAQERTTWKRPGKDTPGISATTGHCKRADGVDMLYVFSSNAAPFEADRCYSPFAVLALLEFDGDFSAAAKSLVTPTGPVTITSVLPEGLVHDDEAEDESNEFLADTPEIIGAMPFPVEALPLRLQDYVNEAARSIRCPLDFPGCFLLAVASIGIGNTRKIALKRKWSESARLYMAIVADPGSAKSPAMKLVCEPLYDLQHGAHEQHSVNRDNYEKEKEEYEAKKKAKDPTAVAPKRPIYRHYWTSDATTEKLADMLKDNPRGMGVVQDEVSALVQGMNQYKQGGKGRDRQFWLSVWDGTPAKVDRKSDDNNPVVIQDPYLTVFGGIQPEMLGALRDEFGREDGFVHRFLFSFPATGLIDEWREDQISEGAERAWRQCFEKLSTLNQHIEPDGKIRPWVVRMDEKAKAAWKRWYDDTNISISNMDPVFQRPMRKMIGYAARLSLIVQMLRWACDETSVNDGIEEVSVAFGCVLTDYFINHMQLVYTRLHEKVDDWQALELLAWVKTRGSRVTVREVVTYGPRWVRKRTLAIKKLQDLDDRSLGTYGETKKPNGVVTRWFELRREAENEEE